MDITKIRIAVKVSKRIGIANGRFKAPADFDIDNKEIFALLRGDAI